MKITNQLTDDAALRELGSRLAAARLERNLTQAALAEQAGVAKRTVERLESGAVATQLSGFLRVCRVLGVLERFDALIPEPTLSPMAQLKLQGRKRQRAASTTRTNAADRHIVSEPKPWTWGKTS